MTDPTAPRDSSAGTLLSAGFLAALVLVLPLAATLGTTTYGGLYAWFAAGIAVVVVVGLLLRAAGVRSGLGLALAAAGAFAVLAPVGLALVAQVGVPDDDVVAALAAGLPAAAIAAPVAAVVVRRAGAAGSGGAVGAAVCGAGLMVAAIAGPPAGQAVLDARDVADRAAELEATGLEPLLPRLEGAVVEYASTTYTRPPGGSRTASGYTLRYEPDGARGTPISERPYLYVDIAFPDGTPPCEPIEGLLTCREGDGYVVVAREGVEEEVVVDAGGVRLSANLREADSPLPDPDEVGRAMADAETVAWEEILRLDG